MNNPKTNLKEPCAACPFMETAAPGWLGPFDSPKELHQRVMMEAPFSCHKTIDHDDQDQADDDGPMGESHCLLVG